MVAFENCCNCDDLAKKHVFASMTFLPKNPTVNYKCSKSRCEPCQRIAIDFVKISLARLICLLSMHGARMGEEDLDQMFGDVQEEMIHQRITFPRMLHAVVGPLA